MMDAVHPDILQEKIMPAIKDPEVQLLAQCSRTLREDYPDEETIWEAWSLQSTDCKLTENAGGCGGWHTPRLKQPPPLFACLLHRKHACPSTGFHPPPPAGARWQPLGPRHTHAGKFLPSPSSPAPESARLTRTAGQFRSKSSWKNGVPVRFVHNMADAMERILPGSP